MQRIILILALLIAIESRSQNKPVLLTMDGIGDLHLGMSQDEVEKLLKIKIPLTNPFDTISGAWYDTADIKYKGLDIRIQFQRIYHTDTSFYMRMVMMRTKSPLCRTSSGIGMGSHKNTIVAAYERVDVLIIPQLDDENTISKRDVMICVRDIPNRRMIFFSMKNKKVVEIELQTYYSDAES